MKEIKKKKFFLKCQVFSVFEILNINLPIVAAKWSGVSFSLSLALTLAPFSIRVLITFDRSVNKITN